jgi:hypothetical protein
MKQGDAEADVEVAKQPCGWCGNYHLGFCPRIKTIEYHENGLTKRIEFHVPATPAPSRDLK